MSARTRLFKVGAVPIWSIARTAVKTCACAWPPFTLVSTRVQELKESARSKDATGIQLSPDESNIFQWRACIKASDKARGQSGLASARLIHSRFLHPG